MHSRVHIVHNFGSWQGTAKLGYAFDEQLIRKSNLVDTQETMSHS